MPDQSTITESRPLAEATSSIGQRQRILLITAGWGSSGYYSPEVLTDAAKNRVFPAGTHMYLDHPTTTEDVERPERSVRDLAAVLATDAEYDAKADTLVAVTEVFPPYRAILAEMRDHIGVSIRATGTVEQGEAEGRAGPIITALTEGVSVDYVTHAGRGGRIVELLESARLGEARNIGHWLESRIHLDFTQLADDMFGQGRLTRDERISLSNAIGEGLAAFASTVTAKVPHLYERDLWDEPTPNAIAAAMEEETQKLPDGTPPTTPKEGAPMSGSTNQGAPPNDGAPDQSEITESGATRERELARRLAEAERQLVRIGENAARTAAAERQLADARAENASLRAQQTARDRTAAALAESGLPDAAWARVTTVVCGSVPLTEAGEIDDDRLTAAITAAIDAERSYIAALAEASGSGVPRGLGGVAGEGPTAEEIDKGLAEAFGAIGLGETAARVAANGRG